MARLPQVVVLLTQGKSAVEAERTIGVTEQTYYCRRKYDRVRMVFYATCIGPQCGQDRERRDPRRRRP